MFLLHCNIALQRLVVHYAQRADQGGGGGYRLIHVVGDNNIFPSLKALEFRVD